MKTIKINFLLILALSISYVSCEKEDTNQPSSSIEEEVAEFQNLLKRSGSEEEVPRDTGSDCSFDGLLDRTVRIGHFVGVNEHPNQFGSDAVVTWTVNGEAVTPRRPRFVRVNDHISQSGTVEVCYSVTSSDCGTLGECVTINFRG